jgi:hypothetical protein
MIDGATDMSEETKQTEPPIAPGLDDLWWRIAASSADAADKEKQDVLAADFQAERTYRYLVTICSPFGDFKRRPGHRSHSATDGGRRSTPLRRRRDTITVGYFICDGVGGAPPTVAPTFPPL